MIHPCRTPGLGPWDQVSCYWERAGDPSFWAEPLNALSNIAFLIAAVMAYTDLRTARPERGSGMVVVLILAVMVVGVGSFGFHTFATKWAELADVIPIALFVFAYLALAMYRFIGLSLPVSILIALAVAASGHVMPPWFNGSFGYAPALASMATVGILALARGQKCATWLLAGAGVFTVSLIFRSIDAGVGCLVHPPGAVTPQFIIGTHALWHILNAVTLYL
ncbi:MAG: ceramidase domain-containing protein, partial [Methyloligellaceae bacterium]